MRELQVNAWFSVLFERTGGGAATAGDDDAAAQNGGTCGRGSDVLSGFVDVADEHKAKADDVSSLFFLEFACLINFIFCFWDVADFRSIKSHEPWFSTIPGSSSSDDEEQHE